MRVGCWASRSHYQRHLVPIEDALPEGVLCGAAESDAVMVGSYQDALQARRFGKPVIYVEHGCGQTYSLSGGPPLAGYPGSEGLGHVALFLCPSARVAYEWRRSYPQVRVAVVGSPALDRFHRDPPVPEPGVVAITHHWDAHGVSPEATSAWHQFKVGYPAFVAAAAECGWEIVGHEHPRWEGKLVAEWEKMGVRTVTYDEVMNHAQLLIADNTSMLPEFASLGRPVVFLNAPAYRREARHGGRFWNWPEGQVQVDQPAHLLEAVQYAFDDPTTVHEARDRMVTDAFAFIDGDCADRAASAIVATLEAG